MDLDSHTQQATDYVEAGRRRFDLLKRTRSVPHSVRNSLNSSCSDLMHGAVIAAAAALFLMHASDGFASQQAAAGAPEASWVVDPTVPEDSRPAAGRSLFDFVFITRQDGARVYDVPYPFSAL